LENITSSTNGTVIRSIGNGNIVTVTMSYCSIINVTSASAIGGGVVYISGLLL
jgi:hypothetical protein